ncbi:MAG: dodecin family protein [Limnochordia bacterium]|nr:dodecin family protein [Limnochordia bacterium]MDD2628695.1 dodecin family protein [Limnochordia bacterium]MDD4517555.1 dodecin family protein [Limnochordia bacterium]
MNVVKVIELIGQSKLGWEDAARQAVKEASTTVRQITGVELKNFTGDVDEEGNIVHYRVDLHLAFKVEDH